jgi:hypothetical protein
LLGRRSPSAASTQQRTVTVDVSETTLAIELPDADTRVVRRTTDQAIRSIKGQRPPTGSVPDETRRRVDLIEKIADESAMVVQ